MSKSKIEWTETTWNPVTGCSKISQGCANCYAETMTKRLQAMGVVKYELGFEKVVFHREALDTPYSWKKPRHIFVNSMSDLFHPEVMEENIFDVFSVMTDCSKHIFQVLTKRAERLVEMSDQLNWKKNIWMGVTVENKDTLGRIDLLRESKAQIKFLSIEPLLENLGDLNLMGIDWVIVGGESGPNARPLLNDWVLEIRDQCINQDTPFFFKQWGNWGADGVKRSKKENGRLLDGRTWNEYPAA